MRFWYEDAIFLQHLPIGCVQRHLLLYNFTDNLDLNRLMDTVKKHEYLSTIYLLLFTMPGLPSIYYGSEWGLRGTTDRVTDWNLRPQIDIEAAVIENRALMEYITRLAGIHAAVPALRHGSYKQLHVAARQLALLRELKGDSALCMVNSADVPSSLVLPGRPVFRRKNNRNRQQAYGAACSL